VTLCFGIKSVRFSRKRQDGSVPNFFQGLENTCLLDLALKNTAPGL